MSSSPRIGGPVIILLGILAWIIALSYGLRRWFGAEVTSGWMLVGVLFTLGAVAVLVILNEIRQAIFVPAGFNVDKWKREEPVPEIQWIDWSYFDARRVALGLSPDFQLANHYRAPKRVPAPARPFEELLPAGGLLARAC